MYTQNDEPKAGAGNQSDERKDIDIEAILTKVNEDSSRSTKEGDGKESYDAIQDIELQSDEESDSDSSVSKEDQATKTHTFVNKSLSGFKKVMNILLPTAVGAGVKAAVTLSTQPYVDSSELDEETASSTANILAALSTVATSQIVNRATGNTKWSVKGVVLSSIPVYGASMGLSGLTSTIKAATDNHVVSVVADHILPSLVPSFFSQRGLEAARKAQSYQAVVNKLDIEENTQVTAELKLV